MRVVDSQHLPVIKSWLFMLSICSTGYIHRLRGYHGIGEDSYYHSNNMLMVLRKEKPVENNPWFREWRAGWTDEDGGLI